MKAGLLEIRDLRVGFATEEGLGIAVDRVSLDLATGETLALVGESGCGKSVTALSILRLLPSPPARLLGGVIRFAGQDLGALSDHRLRAIRGREIAMIFQEPMTSLNPVMTIGDQIVEAIRAHRRLPRAAARERARELLEAVRIPDAARRLDDHPHRLSGGMRQRVMIAIAIACGPKLLIADEPTTALDVTVQAQILRLLARLREELGMGLLLITHNLGVVAETADRVAVMYAGHIVEEGPVRALLRSPRHPYTQGLLAATPRPPSAPGERVKLREIPGLVPSIADRSPGCAFAPRCPRRLPRCLGERPLFRPLGQNRGAACFVAADS